MERQTVTKVSKPATRNHSVQRQSAAPCRSCRFTELQRSVGNQAVQRLINSHYIQAKLQVSSPDDRFEQEADHVADRVMRMADPNPARGVTVSNRMQISRVQRQCAACEAKMQRQKSEEEDEKPIQAKADGSLVQRACTECNGGEDEEMIQGKADGSSGSDVSNGVQSQIENLRGGGEPLPASARTYFEPRFGYDFSRVRIHAGAQAAQVARSINAQAFTVGKDIAFASGAYSPQTNGGKRLLAHELVHVVQQGHAATSASSAAIQPKSNAPVHVARQPSGGPATPTVTNLIRVSCDSNTIEFETDTGVFIYELTECDIENADYIAEVTVTGNDVHFSGPPNAPGAGASWAYRIRPDQPNPSEFFPNQNTVHIVTGTLSPTPGPVPGPTPGPSPGSVFKVCARDLQVSPVGQHGYIEAPPFRYAIISPTCPQHWYDSPVLTGTGGQKWDNSPDPCGKSPTCVECRPKPGVTDLAKCFRDAFNAYNNPSLYHLTGPNSNTFAGTLARTCCAGMVPKPAAFGWMPGWDDSPAPSHAGSKPCPPGPTC